MHADWTLLHSCTFFSFVTELVCALDHSSNAFALAQDCHKIELHLSLVLSLSLLFFLSLCYCFSYFYSFSFCQLISRRASAQFSSRFHIERAPSHSNALEWSVSGVTEQRPTRHVIFLPQSLCLSLLCACVSICVSCVHAYPREFDALGTHATRSFTSARGCIGSNILKLVVCCKETQMNWCSMLLFLSVGVLTDRDRHKLNSYEITAACEEISSLKAEIAHLREELSTCVQGFQSPWLLDFLTGLSGPVSNIFISFH